MSTDSIDVGIDWEDRNSPRDAAPPPAEPDPLSPHWLASPRRWEHDHAGTVYWSEDAGECRRVITRGVAGLEIWLGVGLGSRLAAGDPSLPAAVVGGLPPWAGTERGSHGGCAPWCQGYLWRWWTAGEPALQAPFPAWGSGTVGELVAGDVRRAAADGAAGVGLALVESGRAWNGWRALALAVAGDLPAPTAPPAPAPAPTVAPAAPIARWADGEPLIAPELCLATARLLAVCLADDVSPLVVLVPGLGELGISDMEAGPGELCWLLRFRATEPAGHELVGADDLRGDGHSDGGRPDGDPGVTIKPWPAPGLYFPGGDTCRVVVISEDDPPRVYRAGAGWIDRPEVYTGSLADLVPAGMAGLVELMAEVAWARGAE